MKFVEKHKSQSSSSVHPTPEVAAEDMQSVYTFIYPTHSFLFIRSFFTHLSRCKSYFKLKCLQVCISKGKVLWLDRTMCDSKIRMKNKIMANEIKKKWQQTLHLITKLGQHILVISSSVKFVILLPIKLHNIRIEYIII